MYDYDEEATTGIAGMFKPFVKERHIHNIPGNNSVVDIFSKRYLCRFSDIQTRHPDDLRTFGVRLSGVPEIDKMQRNADVVGWLTIATMAHYVRLGVAVKVVNYSDTKKIYESIVGHIRAWRDNYAFSLNQAAVPIEDLQALETLSELVFPAARSTMRKEGRVKDFFEKAVDKFDLTSEQNLFVRNDYNTSHGIVNTSDNGKNSHIEIVREDHSDYILDRLSKLGGGINGPGV